MESNHAQKMREALIIAKKAICHHAEHICQSLSWENSNLQSNCADVLCAHRELCKAKTAINAALSAPPRNCDVGTAEEQAERHKAYCRKHYTPDALGGNCRKCPLKDRRGWSCQLAWAQTPYEAQEGGAK